MTGKGAGFDFGLKDFLTDHKGKKIKSPEFFKKYFKKLKKAHKKLSSKKPKSNKRKKAKKKG